jgi:DNA-binding transcriptional LysR family regulator
MNVNLRQVRAFVAVYRLGSVTRAAQQLNLTQAAVSLLLRQFEDTLGVRLFDRTTRRLTPTQAALDALPVAQEVLDGIERLVNGARGMREKRLGRFGFAASTSAAAALMAPMLQRFSERYPEVEAVMQDRPPERIVEAVLMDEVEFAIGTPDRRTAAVELTPLIQDRLCVICRADSALVQRRHLRWRELKDVPTISGSRRNPIRAVIDETLAESGQHFVPTHEADYVATSLAMTLQGLGVSVLPSYLVGPQHRRDLVAVPLVGPAVPRTLYAVVKRGHQLSPAAQAFVELLVNEWRGRPPAWRADEADVPGQSA